MPSGPLTRLEKLMAVIALTAGCWLLIGLGAIAVNQIV